MVDDGLTLSWLLKSQNEILGPFSSDQIRQHILDKKITVNDEVALAFGRFRKIREMVDFQELVNTIFDERTESVTEAHMLKTAASKDSLNHLSQSEVDKIMNFFSGASPAPPHGITLDGSDKPTIVPLHPWNKNLFSNTGERDLSELKSSKDQRLTLITFIFLFLTIAALIGIRLFF